MCGRIVQRRRADELAEKYDAHADISEHRDIKFRFNLAPTQTAFAVLEFDGHRLLTTAHWGFLPVWAKDRSMASKMINARLETIATSPAYRASFCRQRALVPADGFYEWQATTAGKVPHYISRTDGEPLALAGIWSSWTDRTTHEAMRTFSILTTEADHFMGALHHRMPVTIAEVDWSGWLDPQVGEAAAMGLALQRPEDCEWQAWPVRRQVNNVRNDGPELVKPVEVETSDGEPAGSAASQPALPLNA